MSGKILVVDSDAATRRTAMQALLPAGYQMCIAEDSFSALGIAQREHPDLIVLADSMTEPGALLLVGRMFSAPDIAPIPVLVVANSEEAQAAADRAGARAVLRGPMTPEDFLHAIEDHIHTPGAISGAPVALLEDPDRLAMVDALRRDAAGNQDLDRFTQLAAKMLHVPVSVITLVDKDKQLYASQTGVAPEGTTVGETPLEYSFCQFAVTSRAALRIDDATTHPLVRSNPAVDGSNIKAYVGIPLIVGDGHAVGTLCAIDSAPRRWTDHEVAILTDLAGILTTQLDDTTKTGRHR